MPSQLPLALFFFLAGAILIVVRVMAAKAVSDVSKERDGVQWLSFNGFYRAYIILLTIIIIAAITILPPFTSLWAWLPWLIPFWSLAISFRNYSLRIGITENYLIFRRWSIKKIPWREIRSVTFSYPQNGWIIETEKHGMLLVPTTLSGTPTLFKAVEEHGIPLR